MSKTKQASMQTPIVALFLILFTALLTGCDGEGERLQSQEVELKDGRTVQCVREIGVNTRMTCDWANAK